MSEYLRKYVGTYRVLAEYDKRTNDWIRDVDGQIDSSFDDFYIPLQKDIGKIMHYDRDILIIYLTDLYKAKKIIKDMKNKSIINKTIYTDEEILIYIKDKDLNAFMPYIQPVTKGKNISPFSVKNLPKNHYEIPLEDLEEYQKIISDLDGVSQLQVGTISKSFIKDYKDFKMSRLNIISYIHKNNMWKEYLKFIKNSLTSS